MSAAVSEETAGPSSSQLPTAPKKQPVVLLVVGMAGTGKTTLVHRLQHYTQERGIRSYFINLDPAVTSVPYNANIDIRDTVSYKEVMRGYRLGPNGAILTSLNLFATKFHQVVSLLESKADLEWVVIDTPGQIEVFTWSASGQLIAESLSATFPTIVLFVADTTRCLRPQTFVSTMLYSSGIMLKQQLPLVLVFNKTDVASADVAVQWMRNSDSLQDAVTEEGGAEAGDHTRGASGFGGLSDAGGGGAGGAGYASTLARSLALFLHEFYEDIPFTAVSAASGAGMEQLEAAVQTAKAQAVEERTALDDDAQQQKAQKLERQRAALDRDVRSEEEKAKPT